MKTSEMRRVLDQLYVERDRVESVMEVLSTYSRLSPPHETARRTQRVCRSLRRKVESTRKRQVDDPEVAVRRPAEVIEFPAITWSWLDEVWDPSKIH